MENSVYVSGSRTSIRDVALIAAHNKYSLWEDATVLTMGKRLDGLPWRERFSSNQYIRFKYTIH